ncbi:hypothetical protein [Streptomyces sp. NPDC001137]|uniref:hypothetical protein n=1 Tax=Streptomyces sp. NPDC001137 TaxID=3154378 RepID=UPI00332D5C96
MPRTHVHSTPTSDWFQMRRRTAIKQDEKWQTGINFNANISFEWLKINLPQIATNSSNRQLSAPSLSACAPTSPAIAPLQADRSLGNGSPAERARTHLQ